jgi:hypothetical protein
MRFRLYAIDRGSEFVTEKLLGLKMAVLSSGAEGFNVRFCIVGV